MAHLYQGNAYADTVWWQYFGWNKRSGWQTRLWIRRSPLPKDPYRPHRIGDIAWVLMWMNLHAAYVLLYPETVFAKRRVGTGSCSGAGNISGESTIYRKLNGCIQKKHDDAAAPAKKPARRRCDHEFEVRGHLRHYKSGKTVFIRPYTKNRGASQKNIHDYRIGK